MAAVTVPSVADSSLTPLVGDWPRANVLIVDDDPAFRRLCIEYLRDESGDHYDVVEANTGAEAVGKCETTQFDCLLIDYRLPDTSGTALVQELRHTCDPTTPMILLTGLGSEELAMEALHIGAADYIPKERVSDKSLDRAIANAIERSRLLKSIRERNERLQRANEELKRKNYQIQRFYHAVSHEIKTPLTAAIEFISLVTDGIYGDVTTDQAEALGYAMESCDQIAAHFNELIDSTRLETGKLRIEKSPCSVRKLVTLSVASARAAIQAKDVKLDESFEPDLPDVEVDGSRIVQVLSNLLGNAEKFTEPGGTITVSAEHSRAHKGGVVIGVRDTGCGIAPEHLPRIFDRLYQANSDSLNTRGLGLGLSIAREIVRLHGGRLDVESEPGRGSVFWVHLPGAG